MLRAKKFKELNRQYILGCFLLITSFVLILPSIYKTNIESHNYYFILTNFLIGLISFVMILKETKKATYSLQVIHWIFQYSFFFIAPAVQYLENTFPWGFLTYNDTGLLVKANFIILIWQFFWILQTIIFNKVPEIKNNKTVYFVSYTKINIVFVLSILVTLYFIYAYGLTGLFTRGSSMENTIGNSSIMLIVSVSLKSIPVVLLTLISIKMKTHKGIILKIIFTASVCLLLLSNFPTSTARYWAAAVYMGLFISYFTIKSKNTLAILLILGLNVIFPIFGAARRTESFFEFLAGINITFGSNLLSGDYDAYSSIGHTLFYIENYGSTLGKQLLTVLLFFIPRSIWPDKSVGSGYLVADSIGLPFNNVSSTLPAEGLINFGIIGVVVFAFFVSRLCSFIDRQYWLKNNPRVRIIYPFWIGFFFFIMRGDMLSSVAYLLGFTIFFFIFSPKLIIKT